MQKMIGTRRRYKHWCFTWGIIWMLPAVACAQHLQADDTAVWTPDLGNVKYRNPVIYADYSDPDVCRVGNDYYLVASSFDAVPGLPILHSRDLVNWTIIGHALPRLIPEDHFAKTQHGNGVWAPAIRYHNDSFYVYFPDPDFGIYLVKARHPQGPWTRPQLVMKGPGVIDPCPFWDNDGQAYLIHAYAGSRAGIKSILVIHKMNRAGTQVIDKGVIVYDGHGIDPTIEGPKLYKRHGYYYIFAPAGGVPQGYQLVLRSKHIYGPYERKVVMHQGNTSINGPHQGAWVQTPDGKQDWFIHFSDRGAYGRITYLEPMKWVNDWPIIGVDQNGDGIGEPVETYTTPHVGKIYPLRVPQTSDDFRAHELGLQWQWQANPDPTWYYLKAAGGLRLYARPMPRQARNLWDVPNILMQKFPAPAFCVTTKIHFYPLQVGDQAGMVIMGTSYARLSVEQQSDGLHLMYVTCTHADEGHAEQIQVNDPLRDSTLWLRVRVDSPAICTFSYSLNGKDFIPIPGSFIAQPGKWIGAKVGIYCIGKQKSNDAGFADVDEFRVTPATD
ncbi:glycoside hydrolase 43 family protein [Thermoflavifilum sp.]|uniref:glycoside hydrolase family 43 protein n=1 Tax=Thermoflavifilum sp. TaxID=1968839 RepID=UPI0025F3BB09|nr:glycoside hydrolase 43 family protein [Thermoflavifilum sp.]